ncbi:MAG: DUF697 domain-containing protein [Chloroflexi bacterium]|nr:DUF697 domain-containing protein [Chloroflexota bacterium]
MLELLILAVRVVWNKLWQRERADTDSALNRDRASPIGMGLASLLNALDWDHLRAEVERESRARIVLIGARGAGKSTLLQWLNGLIPPETCPTDTRGEAPPVMNLGLFTVIDVETPKPSDPMNPSDALRFELENADLVVWVLDGAVGVRGWEHEWIGRVRALGKPILIALNKLDAPSASVNLEGWRRRLGCSVIAITARTGANVLEDLLPRIADTSPQLATALGREIAQWRKPAAARVMRRAEMLSGLAGLEPVPLLDIPFQIFLQLQMVLRIAAIYGQPLNDRYSREMIATMVGSVVLRYAGQQLVKVIPLAGWLASGALAASGTWIIGQLAIEYFENGRRGLLDPKGFRKPFGSAEDHNE